MKFVSNKYVIPLVQSEDRKKYIHIIVNNNLATERMIYTYMKYLFVLH